MKMKRITKLMSVCAITIAMVSMISCKKGDTGPAGPAGPAGAAGPAGVAGSMGPAGQDGNANAMQYIFGDFKSDGTINTQFDFTQGGYELTIPLPNDTLDNAAWFAYLIQGGANTAIPGFGYDNLTQYNFVYGYDGTTADQGDFFVSPVSGPGELVDAIKVVRILISNTEINSTHGGNGRRGLPDIDFKDYNAVKKYYNLSDHITLKPRSK
jgi:hypothetical protein